MTESLYEGDLVIYTRKDRIELRRTPVSVPYGVFRTLEFKEVVADYWYKTCREILKVIPSNTFYTFEHSSEDGTRILVLRSPKPETKPKSLSLEERLLEEMCLT
jgi:hypothetical protein